MAKNHYLVLGVGPNATPEQIRSAYREKAKRLHPDRTGGPCEAFQAAQEAYEVLSDPARRRAYDAQLAAGQTAPTPRGARPEDIQWRRYSVEPLVPRQRAGPGAGFFGPLFQPMALALARALLHESWDDLLSETAPRAGDPKPIHFRVYLTPEEARAGGRVRASIPVQTACPSCRGQGSRGLFACPRCRGTGILAGEYPVEITYPAGIAHRSTWTVPLRQPGLDEMHLVLHFRVGQP